MQQNKEDLPLMTNGSGHPIDNNQEALTAGPTGPILLQDVNFIEKLAHFDRERVPERVVHAKGAGAHGYFEVTKDATKYCKAKFLDTIGKKTPVFVRFSTVIGERGSPDTRRDPRGFAVKFYTEEGNWDLVGNNLPVFFISDAIKFPDFIHSLKRNPQTNLNDMNTMFDFLSQSPESVHMVTMLFSDRGIPDGFRHMHGFGAHTFKWVNDKGEVTFVKFHFVTNQGIKNFTDDEGNKLQGEAPEYATKDLYDAIDRKDFPSWTFCIQAMTPEEAAKRPYDIFDVTKVWSHKEFPLIEIGKMVLDRNVENFHAEVEQVAFSPGVMVPGVEPTNDKMLQGRLFSYPDTQRYRIGVNYQQLPINCPYRTKVHNGQRDGAMVPTSNQGNRLNYNPSRWNTYKEEPKYHITQFEINGMAGKYSYNDKSDHFVQPRALFEKVMTQKDREHLCSNLAGKLKECVKEIQVRQCRIFYQVHPDYGKGVADLLGLSVDEISKGGEEVTKGMKNVDKNHEQNGQVNS